MAKPTVTVTDNQTGQAVELPLVEGTHGAAAIDISALPKHLGHFAFDPGFLATASCRSGITYIDGEAGVLLYRGYPIEQLAEHCSFIEVAYLLIYGELPTADQLEGFRTSITYHTMINESVKSFYRGFHHDAHPMAIMVGVVGSLAAFYHDATDIGDPHHRTITAHRLVAKMPTIAAAAYKHSVGEPFVYPLNTLSYAGNLLRMMFALPTEEYQVDPVAEEAVNLLFILHADHEQNASTSTIRQVGSTGADPFACVAAGIASLWGPAHGGAAEAVVEILQEIGEAGRIPEYIARAKDKEDPFRLMGFGHRIYKNYDPRARLIRETCHKVLQRFGDENDPLFELAMRLEETALQDEYFIERKLYPNVDFYSGIIYKALGIPMNMFTVMFAIARTAGWVAHWMEMVSEKELRIGRPRQVYDGVPRRDVPLERR